MLKHRYLAHLLVLVLIVVACSGGASVESPDSVEVSDGGSDSVADASDDPPETTTTSINVQSDEDGENAVVSGTDEDGTEIPADFPMPVFEPSEVLSVVVSEVGGGTEFLIELEIAEGDADAAIAFYEDWYASGAIQLYVNTRGSGEGIYATLLGGNDVASANVVIWATTIFQLTLHWVSAE